MSDFKKQLKHLLKQDLVDLEELKKILSEEKRHITTRSTDKIKELSEFKSLKVKQLESRAKLKAQLIAKSGLGIKPGKVEAGITKLNDKELLDLWKASSTKMLECKDMNLVNGNIISRSLQRTNKLMAIMRGQRQNNNLYGQQGREQSYGGSHRIGSA